MSDPVASYSAEKPLPGGGDISTSFAIQGSWVIGGILGLGLAAAIFAWLFQHYQTDDALAFWGSEAAQRIRLGEKVELLELAADGDPAPGRALEQISGGDRAFVVISRRDLSQAPGLIHARQALLQDASYRFDPPPSDCQSRLALALRFTADGQATTLLLDLACPRVRQLETGKEVKLGERLAEGLKKFLGEHLDERKTKTPASSLRSGAM